MTLPGLPTSSDRSADIVLVVEPEREVVEIRTDDERAVYVVEPIAVEGGGSSVEVLADLSDVAETAPTNGQVLTFSTTSGKWAPATPATPAAGTGLIAHADSGNIAIQSTILTAGTLGSWAVASAPWRLTVAAAVGDVLEWEPAIALGGGPAAIDLAAVTGTTVLAYASSGTAAPTEHGLLYTQGDYGSARLPSLKWTVASGHLVNGQVTLALAFRAYATEGEPAESMKIGHATLRSRHWLSNLGPVVGRNGGGSAGAGGGTATPANAITWSDLGTPGAPPPTSPTTGTIPSTYTVGSRMFFGNGTPVSQPASAPVRMMSVTSDVYLDRDDPALWAKYSDGSWQMILDLRSDTRVYLGMGDPTEVPELYHRVYNLGIDVATADFYELPGELPPGDMNGE